jgi:hypothetical protein
LVLCNYYIFKDEYRQCWNENYKFLKCRTIVVRTIKLEQLVIMLAAYRKFITCVHSLLLSSQWKQKEWNIIQHISKANNFSHTLIQNLNSYIQHNLNAPNWNISTIHNSKPWMTFTYYNPIIQKITNLFKHTKVNITVCSSNTIYNLIKPKIHSTIDKYTNSGFYELICAAWKLFYVGQTSQSFKQWYREHMRYITQNAPQLICALHIVNNIHEYGPTDNIMSLFKQVNRGPEFLWAVLCNRNINKINWFQNKIHESETQCTSWYLTFSYVAPTNGLNPFILLTAFLPHCSTMKTASIITGCSDLFMYYYHSTLYNILKHL